MRFIVSTILSLALFATFSMVQPALADEAGVINDPLSTLSGTPADAAGHNQEGMAAMAAGDNAGAITHFQAGLKSAPNNQYIHYNLGLAYDRAGKHSEATASFKNAIKNAGENDGRIRRSKILKKHLGM